MPTLEQMEFACAGRSFCDALWLLDALRSTERGPSTQQTVVFPRLNDHPLAMHTIHLECVCNWRFASFFSLFFPSFFFITHYRSTPFFFSLSFRLFADPFNGRRWRRDHIAKGTPGAPWQLAEHKIKNYKIFLKERKTYFFFFLYYYFQ